MFYRPDKRPAPDTGLPVLALRPDDGWCDEPGKPDYNRLMSLPCPVRHERLWRADGVYDLIVELGFNDDPPVAGAGSAIFLHVARPDYASTEGCVALAEADLRAVLLRLGGGSMIGIRP